MINDFDNVAFNEDIFVELITLLYGEKKVEKLLEKMQDLLSLFSSLMSNSVELSTFSNNILNNFNSICNVDVVRELDDKMKNIIELFRESDSEFAYYYEEFIKNDGQIDIDLGEPRYRDLDYDDVFSSSSSSSSDEFGRNILNNLHNPDISLYDQRDYDNYNFYPWRVNDKSTIATSGCSFMAKCSFLSACLGQKISPEFLLRYVGDTKLSNVERSLKVYDNLGIKYTRYGSGSGNGDITTEIVIDALMQGKVVEVMVSQKDGQTANHVILLTGISDDGMYVYVNDSWGPMYERKNHEDWLVSGYPVEKLFFSSEQNAGLGFGRGYGVVIDPVENKDIIQNIINLG